MDGNIDTQIVDGHTALITIDRPEKRNSLTPKMIDQLQQAFHDFDADEAVRVIVLTGAGGIAFCAGHDIKAVGPDELGHLYEEAHMQVFLCPRKTMKPVIAAINGSAYAGGFCLAIASDLRLASSNATFAVPAGRLGVVPIAGQSSRLPHLLPPAIVNEMVMCGTPLASERAERHGFVNEVVSPEELLDRALEKAAGIAAMSAATVQSYKRIAQTTLYRGVEAADAMEYWLAMAAGQGEDIHEGLAAFREKRAPDFSSPNAKT